MTAGDGLLRMNWYVSPRLVAAKLQEKGVVWCLQRGAGLVQRVAVRAGLALVSIVLAPLVISMALARVRFLTGANIWTRIGALAIEPEIYVKLGLVGWRPRHRGILLVQTIDTIDGTGISTCSLASVS